MNRDTWSTFHRRWPRLKAPLACTAEIARAIAACIGARDSNTLLLGVTPPLAGIAADTTAADWSDSMIAEVWPGNAGARRAVQADWRTLPFRAKAFTAIIGDGSFNCLVYPDEYRVVLEQLARVARPRTRLAVRVFATPARCETLAELRGRTLDGEIAVADALKWRVAMALAAKHGANVSRAAVYDAFVHTFPDVPELLQRTGWHTEDLDTFRRYEGVPDSLSFPTEEEVETVIPECLQGARFEPSGVYELAERCPILVADFAP
jgi:SAM-dependent methyltransferase